MAMFWIVTACTLFCATSLASVLLYFTADSWIFSRTMKTRVLPRILNPDMQSEAIGVQLRHMLRSPLASKILRNFLTKKSTMPTDAEKSPSRVSKTTNPGPRNELPSKGKDEIPEAPELSDVDVDIYCYSDHIRSLRVRQLPLRKTTQIYDMQYSPDGRWLAVCTTLVCYVISVEYEVSYKANGG